MIWLVLAYFLHTTGELCLSPVGLAMVTQLSVARIVGMVMGVWFLSSAFAANLGALIARTASLDQVDGSKLTGTAALEVYTGLFANLGQVALVIGLGLLIAAALAGKTYPYPQIFRRYPPSALSTTRASSDQSDAAVRKGERSGAWQIADLLLEALKTKPLHCRPRLSVEMTTTGAPAPHRR